MSFPVFIFLTSEDVRKYDDLRTHLESLRIVLDRLALCSGRVFGHDSARAEPCSAFWHSARAKCSNTILLGQNRARPFRTLLGQSVRTRFCSGRTIFGRLALCSGRVFGHDFAQVEPYSAVRHSARAECSDTILFGQNRIRPFGTLLGQSVRTRFCSGRTIFGRLALCSGRVFGKDSAPTECSNALGDVKDQAEDEANPKPWYTADEKSSKMCTEDLVELLREYPLPVGWYAGLPDLQEPANYGTKYETGIYEEQVRSGYRLPLHPFALRFFEHYHMAPGQLVPNGWKKLIELINGQRKWKNATRRLSWHLVKSQRKKERKVAKCRVPPAPKKIRVIPPDHSPQIVEKVSIEEDPIFRPRWTLRSNDVGMPDSQISEQHLVHGVLPRDKEIFQNQTHETFACSFAQAMYASGSEMLSRFEMARQVAAEEAQQKREALKEAKEATRRAEELNQTLERRLERAKRRMAEEVKKAHDQGIRNFLDGKAGDEWLKKCTDDGLEIYELGFAKAKEMFAKRFPVIPLDDFVLPAVISLSGETVLPSDAGDAAASHPLGEGPFGDAPEP
ncbi:hypothetical protein RJ639_003352 [Escallonia herrerae]|uniref:Uncharacterized protein n=1 Tax=Escallonia herrerae TaxID=1293975 RepID=A0AA88W0Y1_9ASTE|nr:hypothetical protein RJ639_003352 [Escallonia herrerae]